MSDLDPTGLAARVQGLIHGGYKGDLTAAAERLRVEKEDLRTLVEGTDQPHLDVLAALIREFGIDACWLLTGQYDYDIHRRALELEEDGGDTEQLLRLVMERREPSARGRRFAMVTRDSYRTFAARSGNLSAADEDSQTGEGQSGDRRVS